MSSEARNQKLGFFMRHWVTFTTLCGLFGLALGILILFQEDVFNPGSVFGNKETDIAFFIENPAFAAWAFLVIFQLSIWFLLIVPTIGIVYRMYIGADVKSSNVSEKRFYIRFIVTYAVILIVLFLLLEFFKRTFYDDEPVNLLDIEKFDSKIDLLTIIGISIGSLCLAGFIAVEYCLEMLKIDLLEGKSLGNALKRFGFIKRHLQSLLVIGSVIIGLLFLSTGNLYNAFNSYEPAYKSQTIYNDSLHLLHLKKEGLEKKLGFDTIQYKFLLDSLKSVTHFDGQKEIRSLIADCLKEISDDIENITAMQLTIKHYKTNVIKVPYDFVYLFAGLFSLIIFIFYLPVSLQEREIGLLLRDRFPPETPDLDLNTTNENAGIMKRLPDFLEKGIPILSPIIATSFAQILQLIFGD